VTCRRCPLGISLASKNCPFPGRWVFPACGPNVRAVSPLWLAGFFMFRQRCGPPLTDVMM